MDNDEIIDELATFGLKLENERAVNALSFFLRKYSDSADDIVDSLVAYATNNKLKILSPASITDFVDTESEKYKFVIQRQENIPPSPKIPPVKREPIAPVETKFTLNTTAAPLKISQTAKGIISAKVTLEDDAKLQQLHLIPNAFKAVDDNDGDVNELLNTEEDVTVSGYVFGSGNDNELGKTRIMSKKYGNFEVDFSKVSEEFIFDKMFVTVEGTVEGNVLKVRNVVPPQPPVSADIVRPSLKLNDDFARIMVACGPFLGNNSFERVFAHAKDNGMKLVVIFGPMPCNETADTLDIAFDGVLSKILALNGDNMSVAIVPPTDDDPFILYPEYPTTAYTSERYSPEYLKSKRIYLLDNPSVFSFDGIQIAVANFDTMKALSSGTCVTSAELPTANRMNWYVQRMLRSGNVCPTYSSPSTMKANEFVRTPSIFICPSKLMSLAAGIEDVIFVNICAKRHPIVNISPRCVETNGEAIRMEFEVSFFS